MKKSMIFLMICLLLFTQSVKADNEDDELLFVEGYVFIDENQSLSMDENEQVSGLKMNLWQDGNLMDVTLTDEEGYYDFEGLVSSKDYQITAECPVNCTLSKHGQKKEISNDFTIMQDYQVKTEIFTMNDSYLQFHLGLTPIAYYLSYDTNGGTSSFDGNRYYQKDEKVDILSSSLPEKEGYTFQQWNTKQDGSGESYQIGDYFMMPMHNVTLYAIWEKQTTLVSATPISKTYSTDVVHTSDMSDITFFSLLILASLGGLLVVKSLKKR